MTDHRETTDQLDLFRQPAEPQSAMEYIAAVTKDAYAELGRRGESLTESTPEERVAHFRGQLTELPGETFEDIFGDAA